MSHAPHRTSRVAEDATSTDRPVLPESHLVSTLGTMIIINVRFRPLPEYLENFREVVADFTDAARAEDGCLFFEWYRNTDDPEEYLLIEIYKDGTDVAHVESDHFKAACEMFPTVLRETPQIINDHIDGKTEWDRMAEFSVD